jgi:uncharacterized membrane protein
MPFCSQCGNQVGDYDVYCGRCGRRQPGAGAAHPAAASAPPDPLAGVPARTASILCYVPAIGWICAVIVLASVKFRNDRTVRFHAFQGIYLFVATLIADFVIRPMFWLVPNNFHLYQLVQLVLIGASVFMMVKASHDEAYSLPLFGELAQRSVTER